MVVSSRLRAPPPRSALPEKSLELLTMTLRASSSSSPDVAPSRRLPRPTSAVNHEKNLEVFPVLRRSDCDVAVPSAPAAASSRDDSGDWRPGISGARPVSLSVSIFPGSATAGGTACRFSRSDGGDGGLVGHLSVRERMLPLRRARSRASRRLTAFSRRR